MENLIEELKRKAEEKKGERNGALEVWIGTHDGTFHADELLAIAVIRYHLGRKYKVYVDRCRDVNKISYCDVLVDIGRGKYDHHGPNNECYPNGIPMAACGKVLRDVVGPCDLYNVILNSLFYAVELRDNCGPQAPLPPGIESSKLSFVSLMNETGFEIDDNERSKYGDFFKDSKFENALDVVEIVYDRAFKHALHTVGEREFVDDAPLYADAFIEIPNSQFCTSRRAYNDEKILGAVYPDRDSRDVWCVRVARDAAGGNRAEFPHEWAGLEGEALEKVSGIPGAKFCHRGLWFATFNGRAAAETAMRLLASKR